MTITIGQTFKKSPSTPAPIAGQSIQEPREVDYVEKTYRSNAPGGLIPVELYWARRRRRLLFLLALTMLMIWLSVVVAMTTLLMFRYFHHQQLIWGYCGADMRVDNHYERLQQRVEVDEPNGIERIEVPKFGHHLPAVFVHDFKRNLTAIVDIHGRRCFLKSTLGNVLPPKSYGDLLMKIKEGYYKKDAAIIHEHYSARMPPISVAELGGLGSYMITNQCADMPTFWLHRIYRSELLEELADHQLGLRKRKLDGRWKRSVMESKCEKETFAEFTPNVGVFTMHIGMDC